jgi:hypothetical protein
MPTLKPWGGRVRIFARLKGPRSPFRFARPKGNLPTREA